MKKAMVILAAFLFALVIGCAKTNNTDGIDLNAIIEEDQGNISLEYWFNHKNVVPGRGQYFFDDNAQKEMELTFDNVKYQLTYKESLSFPFRSKTVVHLYYINGDENKTISLDQDGNLFAIMYPFAKLDVSSSPSPEEVLEALKKELEKILDISYYEHIELPAYDEKPDEYIGEYCFYNSSNGYRTDFFRVSVHLQDGDLFASSLFIWNLKIHKDELTIRVDKNKESAAIELKLKDLCNTDVSRYQSHHIQFEPQIVQHDDQLYVHYLIGIDFLYNGSPKGSFLNALLIPLDMLTPESPTT